MDTPEPLHRRWGEPIERLPHPRNSRRDRHHLFWPGGDMIRGGLQDLRDVPCASAYGLDSLVHSLIHQRFGGLHHLRFLEDAADFRQRGWICIEQHAARECGCFTPRSLVVVDALELGASKDPDAKRSFRSREFNGPPCQSIRLDERVYELIEDLGYYQTGSITPIVRDLLKRRCDNGLCGCIVNGVRRPPSRQEPPDGLL